MSILNTVIKDLTMSARMPKRMPVVMQRKKVAVVSTASLNLSRSKF